MSVDSDNKINIAFREAELQDLDSLETIIPRAFFGVNEFMRTLFPDTPAMREWWRGIFEEYIRNPNFHIPVAIDTSTQTVVGALPLRGVRKGQAFGGFMAQHPATEDHPAEIWSKAIERFIENEKETVGHNDRFLVEVMGVDEAYQGRGVGKQLVARVCEIADAKGYPIFLETSRARDFYVKQGRGFQVVCPDGDAAILVRQPPTREGGCQ
ncbi:acyl-CoA N-acyltransferase [Xylariaceae sp. FL1272]|nr:acyl-CoA N-acyltransferase [Xylariaceae sp. FL1272]